MSTVKIDIIEGSGIRRTVDGWETPRVARVSGLVGSPEEINYQAILAVDAHGETIGSPHPTIPGVRLHEQNGTPDGPSSVVVALVYRTPQFNGGGGFEPQVGDAPRLSIGSSVQTTTTEKDYAGADLAMTYTPTDEEVDNGEMQDLSYPVIGKASVQVPQVYFRYVRRETTSPGPNAQAYVGRTNSVTFLGQAPKMWLCTHIAGDSTDNGESYVTNYEFLLSQSSIGWDVSLRAEKDGKPMAGTLTDGVHIKTFQVYPTADFNNLALA